MVLMKSRREVYRIGSICAFYIYIHTYTHIHIYKKCDFIYEKKHVRLEAISPRKQLGIYVPEQNFFCRTPKEPLLLLIS